MGPPVDSVQLPKQSGGLSMVYGMSMVDITHINELVFMDVNGLYKPTFT